MQQPQPRQFDQRDRPDEEQERPGARKSRLFRPPKFLIGLFLIAIGVIWSVLNATAWAPKGVSPGSFVAHGSVPTHVQAVGGVRVRPVLSSKSVLSRHVDVLISFDSGAAVSRLISPRGLRLVVGEHALASIDAGTYALRSTMLAPGGHITGALRFAGTLTPGMTLIYTPSWDARHPLRWALWR